MWYSAPPSHTMDLKITTFKSPSLQFVRNWNGYHRCANYCVPPFVLLDLTLLFFTIFLVKIQIVPKMWRYKLSLVLLWLKTRRWHCTAVLSPTREWPLLPGWRRLMERLKPSRRLRPSKLIPSVFLTAEFTTVQPAMKSGPETRSRLRLKSSVSRSRCFFTNYKP